METQKELNDQIIAVTQEIREKNPELLKFMDEMPITIPNENNPEINNKTLKDYLESLQKILAEYKKEHLDKFLNKN